MNNIRVMCFSKRFIAHNLINCYVINSTPFIKTKGLPSTSHVLFMTPNQFLCTRSASASNFVSSDDSTYFKEYDRKPLHIFCKELRHLISEKKLHMALNLYDEWIKNKRRLNRSCYNILIWGCGLEGNSQKAYVLYTQMKERGIHPSNVTYTCLFNSYSNSSDKLVSLKLSKKTLRDVKKFGIILNKINYHAMIKAFGRCEDILTTFDLIDDMMNQQIPLDSETFSFLFQGCLSQKENGFLLTLLVWAKMKQYQIPATIFHYNLLLEIISQCGVQVKSFEKLCQHNESQNMFNFLQSSCVNQGTIASIPPNNNLPVPQYNSNSSAIDFSSVEERLSYLGGVDGILQSMRNDSVDPDILFFTNLLCVIPQDSNSEMHILALMNKYNVSPDATFLCMLMRRRSMQHNFTGAKAVLNLFSQYDVKLNIMVFGVLAYSCRNKKEAVCFLEDLNKNSIRPNVEILGCLLYNGCKSLNYSYILFTLKQFKKYNIQLSKKCLDYLRLAYNAGREIQLQIDDNKDVSPINRQKVEHVSYGHFVMAYNSWVHSITKPESSRSVFG